MWGLDLTGTEQGAGGVGGLLLFNDSADGSSFPAYDGNGNVVGLYKGSDSTLRGDYEYEPFGQLVRVQGSGGLANPIRFSSKYQDQYTDLNYYGYRYYSASLGRWLNPDPVGEKGSLNMYNFLGDSPLQDVDPDGLCAYWGNCGPDVTSTLNATLNDITRTYRSWKKPQKRTACETMVNPRLVQGYWLITSLANLGYGTFIPPLFAPAPQGTGGCDRTVSYRGSCFFAGDVHYLMYGRISSLCREDFSPSTAFRVSMAPTLGSLPNLMDLYSLDWALDSIRIWKSKRHKGESDEYVLGAMFFTSLGYSKAFADYTPLPKLGFPIEKYCNTSKSVATQATKFDWNWYPNVWQFGPVTPDQPFYGK
jgi:RHS repeat-associated protein